MQNIKSSKQLNKVKTSYTNYFLAILKNGAYIEKQTMLVDSKEVVSYRLQKDFHVTENSPFKNIIYGQINFELLKKLKNFGFKVRKNKNKCTARGDTRAFFFTNYSIPMMNS